MTTHAALRQPSETLEELARRLEPRLKRIFGRYRVPAQDTEDLLQIALIATFRSWSTLTDPEGWLIRTVINQCLMYHRSRRRRVEQPLDDSVELLPVVSPETRFADRQEVERRLARLPVQCQQIFRLRFLYGFSAKEVAELLGRTVSSIYNSTHRCTKLLEDTRILPNPGRRGADPGAGNAYHRGGKP